MASFFTSTFNPFSTPVGAKIEKATDASLASEDWALNMEICDIINETEDGPKDALRAIKKRLSQYASKDHTVIMYTLTVLETCVKNCTRKFHILVCSKDFIQELVKLIGPKNDPPLVVQEKVLSLIQSWVDAFKDIPDLIGVCQVYQELRLKGVEFPMTDFDAMAPILTPKKVPSKEGHVTDQGNTPRRPIANVGLGEDDKLSTDQINKLHKDLSVVQANIDVLNEMLTTLTPGQEHSSDIELLTELHATCKAMQERVVQLISRYSQEDFITELLQVNDVMNNLFLRYNRYYSNREAATGAPIKEVKGSKPEIAAEAEAALISLDEPIDLLSGPMKSMSVSKPSSKPSPTSTNGEDSDFDMFAQSRNVTYESSKNTGSSYEDNFKPAQLSGLREFNNSRATPPPSLTTNHKESDFDEMAAWLGEGGSANTSQNKSNVEETLTSSEFERFLEERALAAETTPSQTTDSNTITNNNQQPSAPPASRSKPAEPPVFGVQLAPQ